MLLLITVNYATGDNEHKFDKRAWCKEKATLAEEKFFKCWNEKVDVRR